MQKFREKVNKVLSQKQPQIIHDENLDESLDEFDIISNDFDDNIDNYEFIYP